MFVVWCWRWAGQVCFSVFLRQAVGVQGVLVSGCLCVIMGQHFKPAEEHREQRTALVSWSVVSVACWECTNQLNSGYTFAKGDF